MEKKFKLSYAKAIDPEKKTVSAMISTFQTDRDNERFVKGAWDFSNYMKNPVVLWSHDMKQLPIGRSLDIVQNDDGVMSVAEFDKQSPFAMQVFSLYERGFLNAFSVGFIRKDFMVEDRENGDRGIAITNAELYEYSAVAVPANPGALVGRDIAEMAIKTLGDGYIKEMFGSDNTTPSEFIVCQPSDLVHREIKAVEDKKESPDFEKALKLVIELARMTKGNPLPDTQKALLLTAIDVLKEAVTEHKEPLEKEALLTLKNILAEFAMLATAISPEAADPINKTILQIDKAVTGVAE